MLGFGHALGYGSFGKLFVPKQSAANQLILYDICTHPNENKNISDAKGTTTLIHVILIHDRDEKGLIQKFLPQEMTYSRAMQLATNKNYFSIDDNEWNQIKDHFPNAFDYPVEDQNELLNGNKAKHVRLPIVSENVIARIQNDRTYFPEPLNLLKQFNVYKYDGSFISYPADFVEKLWKSRIPAQPLYIAEPPICFIEPPLYGMALLRKLNQELDTPPVPMVPLKEFLRGMQTDNPHLLQFLQFLQFSSHGSRLSNKPNISWEGPITNNSTTTSSNPSSDAQNHGFIQDYQLYNQKNYK